MFYATVKVCWLNAAFQIVSGFKNLYVIIIDAEVKDILNLS